MGLSIFVAVPSSYTHVNARPLLTSAVGSCRYALFAPMEPASDSVYQSMPYLREDEVRVRAIGLWHDGCAT